MSVECPTIAEFRARFPEFELVPDDSVQVYLDDACGVLSKALFGETCWKRAAFYYSAHLLSTALRTRANSQNGVTSAEEAGLITGSSVGSLSLSYEGSGGEKSGAETWFDGTPYGRQFFVIAGECVNYNTLAGYARGF